MTNDIRYERDGHAWQIIVAGEPRGSIVRELGGYAFLPLGFHGLSCHAESLEELQVRLERLFLERCQEGHRYS